MATRHTPAYQPDHTSANTYSKTYIDTALQVISGLGLEHYEIDFKFVSSINR